VIEKAAVVCAARHYLGVRWHHQGRSTAGVDCLGLIVCTARDLGIDEARHDLKAYARLPSNGVMERRLSCYLSPGNCDVGDILLFRFSGEPQHLGIVTDYGMIHAFIQAHKVVEHRLDEVWRSRIVRSFSFPGVC